MMRKIFLCLIVVLFSATNTSLAQVKVRGKAVAANPSIKVDMRTNTIQAQSVATLLKFSNWFEVSNSKTADYSLKIVSASASQIVLEITPRGGNTAKIVTNSPNGQLLLHKAADNLINAIFNRNGGPRIGICASQIAFVGQKSSTVKEIFIGTAPSLSNARQLTHNNRLSVEPKWSPDGKQILYTLYESNGTNVILANLARGSQRVLSAYRGLNAGASFSRRGQDVALILSKDGKSELYKINLASRKLQRLTNNNFEEAAPVWSPKSDQIVAVSNNNGRPNLYLFTPATNKAQLLFRSTECQSPDWSAVSNQICFSMRHEGSYAIAMVDMNNLSSPKILTSLPGTWESPSWAPDGRHIVASRQYQGSTKLYMIDSWYGSVRPLATPNVITATLPSWSSLQ